jgi:hypothetical protein
MEYAADEGPAAYKHESSTIKDVNGGGPSSAPRGQAAPGCNQKRQKRAASCSFGTGTALRLEEASSVEWPGKRGRALHGLGGGTLEGCARKHTECVLMQSGNALARLSVYNAIHVIKKGRTSFSV